MENPNNSRQKYYDLELFPRLNQFSQKWNIIREEFLKLDAPVLDIHRVGKELPQLLKEIDEYLEKGGKNGWILAPGGPEDGNSNWLNYILMLKKAAFEPARSAMPQTISLLEELGGIKTCALSTLKSTSILPVHDHPELPQEGLLQMHITIDVCKEKNFSYLNVNGEWHRNILGDAFVFDGSSDHFAINASHHDRTILYMEFYKDHHL